MGLFALLTAGVVALCVGAFFTADSDDDHNSKPSSPPVPTPSSQHTARLPCGCPRSAQGPHPHYTVSLPPQPRAELPQAYRTVAQQPRAAYATPRHAPNTSTPAPRPSPPVPSRRSVAPEEYNARESTRFESTRLVSAPRPPTYGGVSDGTASPAAPPHVRLPASCLRPAAPSLHAQEPLRAVDAPLPRPPSPSLPSPRVSYGTVSPARVPASPPSVPPAPSRAFDPFWQAAGEGLLSAIPPKTLPPPAYVVDDAYHQLPYIACFTQLTPPLSPESDLPDAQEPVVLARRYRVLANGERKKMRMYSARAKAARTKQDRQAARSAGNMHKDAMQKYDNLASKLIYKEKNERRSKQSVDLHGQTATEAKALAAEAILHARERGDPQITFIVGAHTSSAVSI
ncbi:hypothetical protein FA95DRAFT_355536 [Auriscalpium vulgare]|uniref:Uncharacterized protein n=1 Tax=Auriscalpium vulgare TaxID=40419 RepID=A0ACB8S4Z7_9AGAM|nr:hypothetical protein FA95DRAFT_355536 [Auriscalpium vulgare]